MSKKVTRRSGMLFCLVGPTAGGKTSLSRQLLNNYSNSLKLSISATTRAPRHYEKHEIDYHFINRLEFEAELAQGKFFEWAEVHGNFYGTYKKSVEDSIGQGIDLLLDIDIQGVKSFKQAFPDATVVTFVVPPTIEELKTRIQKRSHIAEEELEKRLTTAAKECSAVLDLADQGLVDYFVVNKDKQQAEKQIMAIYESETLRVQRFNRDIIKQLCLFC